MQNSLCGVIDILPFENAFHIYLLSKIEVHASLAGLVFDYESNLIITFAQTGSLANANIPALSFDEVCSFWLLNVYPFAHLNKRRLRHRHGIIKALGSPLTIRTIWSGTPVLQNEDLVRGQLTRTSRH